MNSSVIFQRNNQKCASFAFQKPTGLLNSEKFTLCWDPFLKLPWWIIFLEKLLLGHVCFRGSYHSSIRWHRSGAGGVRRLTQAQGGLSPWLRLCFILSKEPLCFISLNIPNELRPSSLSIFLNCFLIYSNPKAFFFCSEHILISFVTKRIHF